jgi:type II secretory pathway component PulK
VGRQATAATAARRPVTRNVVSPASQAEQQTADLAKLLHSSLVDVDMLSRSSIVSDSRDESAMKYLGLWATRQVNVNTAPRQVLEATLTFGSPADAPKIADEIIRQRRFKPFASVDEVKNGMLQYSPAIEKCKAFLTTTSTVLTIKITATSGAAKSTLVAAVTKEGNKIKQIGVTSD